jgi:two-component system cell cycle response regulator
MTVTGRQLVTGAILALFIPYTAYSLFGVGRAELGPVFGDVGHYALMLAAAGLAVARALRVRRQRLAWAIIAAGMVSYALGDISYWVFLKKLDSPPFPSVSDGLWLAFYPMTYVGLVLLLRSRVREFQASLWLDGVIASLTAAAIGAAVIFGLVTIDTGGSVQAVVTTLAYPLGDIILLSIVAAVYALAGRRPGRDWLFLGAGLCGLVVTDVIWLNQISEAQYVPSHLLDMMYPFAALLIGAAAWQPSRTDAIELSGLRRILVPVGACVVAISIQTYDHFHPVADIAILASTALGAAITARLALSFRENLRTLASSNYEALTDSLTALGNRRSLLRDLEHRFAHERKFGLAMFDLDGFKVYNDVFGHPAGDALLARLGERLGYVAAQHGAAYRLGGDEFCVLMDAGDIPMHQVVEKMKAALSEHGDGFRVSASYGSVSLPEEAAGPSEAMRLADRRMYAHKQGGRQSAGRQSSSVLLSALAARNPDLGDHLHGVSQLAEQVARRAGLGEGEIEEVRLGAELHDVGKMGLPDAILNKPGPLTRDEWAFVRRHTLIGERILFAAPALAGVALLVRASHERWDGGGYPDGLAGSDIPLGARIISICDSFDAMTSDRPYRAAMTVEEALAEVRRSAGSQFDPVLVDAFCATLAARTQRPVAAEEPVPVA